MDCRTARLLLDFAGPRRAELEDSEARDLENHLAECPVCRSLEVTQRNWEERIGVAIRDVPVPAHLASRLVGHLNTERVRWYRKHILQGVAGLAAAAVVLIGIWVGLVPRKSLTKVDLEGTYFTIVQQQKAEPDQIQQWFQETYSIQMLPPPEFDYRWIVLYDLRNFDGKRVPFLYFKRGEAQLFVYLLAGKEFDLNGAVASPGYANIKLVKYSADAAYLAYFTGDSLDGFLKREDKDIAVSLAPRLGAAFE